ncbi:MAG: chorismate-binding protein [Bdellovibrionales bacterium]|nr:chorismate-binding protein [Bdellovibrionales bacterium]
MKALNLYTLIPRANSNKLLRFTKALSARAYYKKHYIDLLNRETHAFDISDWIKTLDFKVLDHDQEMHVIHLFYELGFLFEKLESSIDENDLLALDIQYEEKSEEALTLPSKKIDLELFSELQFSDYEKQFHEGFKELSLGNCYQFNLTGKYVYSFDAGYGPHHFIEALWRDQRKRGAYSSATYVEALDQLFLSNSPECLFDYEKGELVTRPIKGTLKRHSDEKKEIETLWQELVSDSKSQGELYMITDLLRNDLSRIDLPVAKVEKKKALLLVPGLIHQYSEIKVNLRSHITLKNILEKIFPGGSITGTPKKRVMSILRKIEKRSRGFYCGSTVILSPGKIEASINIRSSVIDFKKNTLSYQAGGGITLMSDVKSEFEEMTYKRDSYIDVLTL